MHRTSTMAGLAMLGCCLLAGIDVASAESEKPEGSKGITVEDLGRGLKSAARNIEKEIPKMGSAIGETFKKATSREPDKQPAQTPAKEKK